MHWFYRHVIYSPETNATSVYLNITQNHTCNYLLLLEKLPTLFAPVPLHHARLDLPSSSFFMLPPSSMSVDRLSSLPSGGPGPPSPPSPKLTSFPSGPRQRPASMSGTILFHEIIIFNSRERVIVSRIQCLLLLV
jgi:hypothetical protein